MSQWKEKGKVLNELKTSSACGFNRVDVQKCVCLQNGKLLFENGIKSVDILDYRKILFVAKGNNYLWQSIVDKVSLYWQCQ